MKERKSYSGKYVGGKDSQQVELKVDVVEYEENGIFYVYSPALDLIGYGKSRQEAGQSWEIVLEEYLNYTLNKNTLIKDLQNMGWNIKKSKKQFTPPTFSWMLQNNEQLTEMYNNHDFQKTTKPITLPLPQVSA
jgi:predicted RNase H-like HicB family nuclease